MPLNGHEFRVDDAWRSRVERRLKELDMNQTELATAAGCSKSLISQLLSGKRYRTQFLPEIHAVLGWTPPSPPVVDQDRDEVMAIFQKLSAKKMGASKLQRWIGFGQAMADTADVDDDKKDDR